MIDWGGWRLYIALFMGAFCLHLTHWAVVTELPSVFWLGRSVALIHLMLAGAEIQTWQIYEDELKMFVILQKWVPFIVICIVIHMLWHYRILYRDISSKKYVISYSYLCLFSFSSVKQKIYLMHLFAVFVSGVHLGLMILAYCHI